MPAPSVSSATKKTSPTGLVGTYYAFFGVRLGFGRGGVLWFRGGDTTLAGERWPSAYSTPPTR